MKRALLLLAVIAACAAGKAAKPPPKDRPLPTAMRNGKLHAIMPDGGTLFQHKRWLRGGGR